MEGGEKEREGGEGNIGERGSETGWEERKREKEGKGR